MATPAPIIERDRLLEAVQDVVRQHLPRWLEQARQRDDQPLPNPPRTLSYEEFLEWMDEDTVAEWEDGRIIMSSPASFQHQTIGDFLTHIMQLFVEHHDLGVIVSAPFQMKLANGREPDILYVSTAHEDRFHDTYLDGPADLVVEIISPESLERDRGTKFVEYETGGIPEYWLIDPLRRQVECYQLNPQGRYAAAFSGETGIYRSAVLPGFWLQIEWLWQRPLPDVAHTAWEIIGLDGLRQLLQNLEQNARKPA